MTDTPDTPGTSVDGILDFLLSDLPDAMAPLQVAEGFPNDGGDAESLWIMDSEMDQTDEVAPRLYTDETGHTNLWLMVGIEGGSAADCRRRAAVHLCNLKAFVKANPSLGMNVCETALMVPVEWKPGVIKDDGGNWVGRDLVVVIQLRWEQNALTY